MKKHYNDPRFEMVSYDLDDVLTASPSQWDETGINGDGGEYSADDEFWT